jgi:hypothetical protein
LIRPGAIGDLIVSLPALESLRAGYTEVWTAGPNTSLIRFAGRVRSIASTGLDLLELDQAPQALLDTLKSFDDIVSWYGASRQEFREAVRMFPFRFFDALPDGSCLASDFYLRQAGQPPGTAPRIPAERWDGGFLALHASSGSPRKNWPHFDDLIARLPASIPVERCERRFDDLYDLARWLAGARLYVGNDSGITHLAAAVGTPTVAVFGPTRPEVWAPPGAVVLRNEADSPLTVDDALRAVIDCWG